MADEPLHLTYAEDPRHDPPTPQEETYIAIELEERWTRMLTEALSR
jgi:hypothetical protein